MKIKSLTIILILAMLIIDAGTVYPRNGPPGSTFRAHPWEDLNNNNDPSPSSGMVLHYDQKVIVIQIFSDFLIWVYIKDVHKRSDDQKDSIKINESSYQIQIIFP